MESEHTVVKIKITQLPFDDKLPQLMDKVLFQHHKEVSFIKLGSFFLFEIIILGKLSSRFYFW